MSTPRPVGWMVVAGIALACAACGFKGPLYLPERNATVVTHPAPAAQSTAPQSQQPAPTVKQKSKSSPGSAQPPQSPPTH